MRSGKLCRDDRFTPPAGLCFLERRELSRCKCLSPSALAQYLRQTAWNPLCVSAFPRHMKCTIHDRLPHQSKILFLRSP
jgi:hypothetical protein